MGQGTLLVCHQAGSELAGGHNFALKFNNRKAYFTEVPYIMSFQFHRICVLGFLKMAHRVPLSLQHKKIFLVLTSSVSIMKSFQVKAPNKTTDQTNPQVLSGRAFIALATLSRALQVSAQWTSSVIPILQTQPMEGMTTQNSHIKIILPTSHFLRLHFHEYMRRLLLSIKFCSNFWWAHD